MGHLQKRSSQGHKKKKNFLQFLFKIVLLTFFFPFFSSNNLWAEYRVYQYFIIPPPVFGEIPGHSLSSTLDPISFKSYYGAQTHKVYLLNTWHCKGHTGQKDFCPAPYKKYSALKKALLEKANKN